MICCVRSRVEGAREDSVIEMRRAQLSFGDGLIAEEVSDLREGWMEPADRVLADEQIVAAVYEALARRHPKSRSRGRLGAPAEMVLRLLILKHVHYPTDSSLLGDGVRVLIRTMKRIGKIAGETGAKLRDRSRSVKLRVLDIARTARSRTKQSREKLNRSYGKLLNATSRVVGHRYIGLTVIVIEHRAWLRYPGELQFGGERGTGFEPSPRRPT